MGKGLSYRAPVTREGFGCDSKGRGGHWKVLVGLGLWGPLEGSGEARAVGVMGCQG